MPPARRLSRRRPVQAPRLPLTPALAAHRLSLACHRSLRTQPFRRVQPLATAAQLLRAPLITAPPAAPAALQPLALPARLLPLAPPIRVRHLRAARAMPLPISPLRARRLPRLRLLRRLRPPAALLT